MGNFTFNGVSSLAHGLRVTKDYIITSTGNDVEVIAVPGRDGELIVSNKRLKSKPIELPCTIKSNKPLSEVAVDIFYSAVKGEKFVCPVKAGTFMDMMYMPDAINAAISLMEADPERLKHRNAFNIASMSFDPEMIYAAIRKHVPDFEMTYQIDPLKQSIADSWPDSLDDSCAREEWDWMPQFDLESMTVDMLEKLRAKLNK